MNEPMSTVEGPSKDARMWAMICHLCGLALFSSIPFANIIAPLVIWLLKREEFAFVEQQGKEAINFQISVLIYLVCCIPLVFILVGIPLMFLVSIGALVFSIIAAVKANEGVSYRYPLTIRFLS